MVTLDGEAADLEEFPRHFPAGTMYAVREDDSFYVLGEALERLGSASEVRDAAQAFVDEASAVISLLWPAFHKPRVGGVLRDHGGGKRDTYVLVSTGEARLRFSVVGVLVGGTPSPPTPVAIRILEAAKSDQNLHRALHLWSDRPRSWHRLYVVIEELQHFVGGSLPSAGYCSEAELRRFTHTANNAEAAGLDARHAFNPNQQPPKKPMTLGEAESFVRTTLDAVLRRAAGL